MNSWEAPTILVKLILMVMDMAMEQRSEKIWTSKTRPSSAKGFLLEVSQTVSVSVEPSLNIIFILVKGTYEGGFIVVYGKYMQQAIGKATYYDPRNGRIDNEITGIKNGKSYEIMSKDVTASPWEAYFSKEMIAMRPLTEI